MSMLCASRIFQARAAVPLPHPSSDWAASITKMVSSGRSGFVIGAVWRKATWNGPCQKQHLLEFADVGAPGVGEKKTMRERERKSRSPLSRREMSRPGTPTQVEYRWS
ncbi:hypothetical protein J3E69DRAFT_343647 [Trichoderma sp. SZMC 28015]